MIALDGTEQDQGQEPKPSKPQEPKPPQQRPDSDFTSPEQAQRFRASQQQDYDTRVSIARGEPPPDFEGKMQRLLQARADGFSKSLVDDRGNVLRAALDPDAALRHTIESLPRFMQSETGAQDIRSYLEGGPLPNGWLPATGVAKSIETQELEWRAKYGREQSPVLSAVYDWVVDPVGNFVSAALQVPADMIAGAGKRVGLLEAGARFDVKADIYGMGDLQLPQIAGTAKSPSTRDVINALSTTKSKPAEVAQIGSEFVGTAYGMMTGVPGKVLGGIGHVTSEVGKALFGAASKGTLAGAGKAIGHGAGVFGAYEGIVAEPGKVGEGIAHGAAAGAAMGFAQNIASWGLRVMFRTPRNALGPDEKSAMDALKKWASENKVFAERGETATAFDKRVVDTWIRAGLPGAPAMPARKLIGYAMRGGADATGFSLLDQQFREDLIDAAWHGDRSKWESVVTKFSGNFLGAAALHMPLSSIVPWQRRQSVGQARRAEESPGVEFTVSDKPVAAPAKPESKDADFSVQPKEPLQLPAPKETRAESLTREANDVMAKEYAARWEQLLTGESARETTARWETLLGESMDNVIALGWKPSEKSVRERAEGEPPPQSIKVELSQSGHSFTTDGTTARPSPALREALSLPAEMPAREMVDAVEKASLQSALNTKAMLPGQEITVGVKGTAGKGEEPAMMRRVVMGEIQEAPLSVEPKWTKAEQAPARGKDALDPEQAQAVGELRTVAETSDTLQPADRSLLNSAIDVLDTVAARNDPSVAETMAAMPKLVEAVQNGEPGAVKALAESLTTKTPEKALADAKPKKPKQQTRPKAEPESRSGERGAIDVEPIADAARAAVEGMEAGAKTGGNIIAKAWNAFQQSQIQKVEAAGRPAEAEIGRDGTTATKRIQSQLDTAGLMDMRRMPRAQLDSLRETVSDGIGGSASLYARAMDRGMAQHFGEASLTPEQQAVVDKGRAVTLEAGRIAEEIGIEQTDSSGKNPRPFKFDPERRVLVREYSPEMAEARRTRRGPLYEAMVKWLGDKYGWTPEEAGKQFADAQSLTSLDATEVRRSIPVVPEFLNVPGVGTVRVLEGRPLEHAERLAFRSSQILGARSVMPRFAESPAEGAQTFGTPPGLEPLPRTAQQLVDRVLTESGPDAAQSVADMVRAMHGMPLTRTPRLFAPGEAGYQTARVVNGLFGLAKSAALSMSFPMNLAEPLTNATHFGMPAIGRGYREVVDALRTRQFADLHRQAVAEGFIADTKLNDSWAGDTTAETVVNSLKKAGEILTAPLRMSQDVNELINYVAARERLAEMRAGNGSRADATSLSLLGFKRPEVDAMLRGEGTPEQYERYQRNIVGELTGGRSQRSAQKSAAGLSPGWNTMVWFTNFFQTRSRVTDRLARDIADGPTTAAKWEKVQQLTKFLALTGLGGLVGNVIKQFVTGGPEGVEDYLREKTAGDALDVTKSIGGLIASGVLGGVGQPIADVFDAMADAVPSAIGLGSPEQARAAREQLGATAVRLVGPLDTVLRIAEGGLQSALPAAKAVNEGLFGAAALAISDKNIQLDNAQDSYYRWLRANRPGDFGKRGGTEEQRQFRDAMREVVDRVAAGKEWGDQELVEAIVEAQAVRLRNAEATRERKAEQGERPKYANLYNEARAAVVASLRSRKILPEPGEFPTEQVAALRAHLGEKNLQTLRDYDAVLELLAKRVQNANLRRQVEERR